MDEEKEKYDEFVKEFIKDFEWGVVVLGFWFYDGIRFGWSRDWGCGIEINGGYCDCKIEVVIFLIFG